MIVVSALNRSLGQITLHGLGVGASGARDTSDLLPWDFLKQFEVQKRQWLKARTKREVVEELAQVQELPAAESAPAVDAAPAPALPQIDYATLLSSAQTVDKLLTRLLELQAQREDDDLAVILLLLH